MRFIQIHFLFLVATVQAIAAAQATLVVQNGQQYMHSLALSPDGRQIVTAGDQVAVLWDMGTASEVRTFSGHLKDVNSASFSPSGKQIVTASSDGTVRVWDPATGNQLYQFSNGLMTTAAVFSPDGKNILAAEDDGTVKLWHVASAKSILQVKADQSIGAISRPCIAFAPNGRQFLTASSNIAQLWDAATGTEVRRFVGHTYPVNVVAFSRDGRLALTGSNDHTAILWEVATGREIHKFDVGESVLSVAFTSGGEKIFVGGEHSTASVWDVGTGQRTLSLPKFNITAKRDAQFRAIGWEKTFGIQSDVVGVAFTADGQSLLTCEAMKVAIRWDAKTGKPLAQYRGGASRMLDVASLSTSSDGTQIWTDGPREWDMKTGVLAVQSEADALSSPTALAPDGHTILLAVESELYAFNPSDGKGLVQLTERTGEMDPHGIGKDHLEMPYVPRKISNILISSDGLLAVTIGRDFNVRDDVRLWSIPMRKELRHFVVNDETSTPSGPPSSWVRSVVFSPDSKQLLQAGPDRIVKLWDTATGSLVRSFITREAKVTRSAPTRSGLNFDDFYDRIESLAVGFSPDGNRVLTGGYDGLVRVWDKASGREIMHAPTGASNPIENAAFTPDGRLILVALGNGFLLLDAASGMEIYRAEGYASPVTALRFFPDGHRLVSAHSNGALMLWSLGENKIELVSTLLSLTSGGWVVVDPLGRFDTDSLDGNDALHWVVSDDPFHPLPMEVFMQQYYTPKLLAREFAGDSLPAVPSIASINRVQPIVSEPIVEEESGKPGMVMVRLKAASQSDGKLSSGLRDLRVFRDGHLVKFQEGTLKNGEFIFEDIRLPHEAKSEFAAYAFNTDLVKSVTSRTVWEAKQQALKGAPRTFMLNIGVNRNSGTGCDLHYAASDATHLRDVLQSHLPAVTETLLVSDDGKPTGASKTAIRAALAGIAAQATPDDVFLLSFSGHGFTARDGEFYLLPSDVTGSCEHLDQAATLASAISSTELTQWLRPIDAGEMVMILDACYSAASVEAGGFKPGPMGSRGLGQLAYDKRIRILTASQSTQAALENPWIGMGLLTYSLVYGLQEKQADWHPADGKIWLKEWLEYGVKSVPDLYRSLQSGKLDMFRNAPRGAVASPRAGNFQDVNLQTPSLFDFNPKENQGFVIP